MVTFSGRWVTPDNRALCELAPARFRACLFGGSRGTVGRAARRRRPRLAFRHVTRARQMHPDSSRFDGCVPVAVWASPGRNEGDAGDSPFASSGFNTPGPTPGRRRSGTPAAAGITQRLTRRHAVDQDRRADRLPDMRLAHPNGRHRGGLGVPGRSVRVVLAGDAPPASVAARRFRTERGRRASAGWKPNCSTNCSMNCATNCSTNWATLLGCGRGELPGDRVSSRGGNRRGGFRGVPPSNAVVPLRQAASVTRRRGTAR